MIWFHNQFHDRKEIQTECTYAENEKWDEETLNQLWLAFRVCYSGKGAMPIKIIRNSDDNYTIAIGERNRGYITFHQELSSGKYFNSFSADDIDSAIEQLQLVKQKIAELKALDKE